MVVDVSWLKMGLGNWRHRLYEWLKDIIDM